MAGLLNSLEIGKRALNAQRLALTVTGHNLANINTPNFARQRVEIEVGIEGDLLSGVSTSHIRQIRDRALDERIRTHTQDFARSEAQSHRLSELEGLFGDLPGAGITQILSQFWEGWQDATTSPESEATRLTVIERGKRLAQEFKRFEREFRQMHDNLNGEIVDRTSQINQLAESIAELNSQIIPIEGAEVSANDHRDRREATLAELSQLVNVRTLEHEDGSIKVLVGSFTLVDGLHASQLDINTVSAASRETPSSLSDAFVTQLSGADGTEVAVTGGELAGLIEVRDVQIPQVVQQFDQLALVLINEVNQQHRSGYGLDRSTGLDFFSGTGIADMSISPRLQSQPEKLAVSQDPDAEGDNQTALAIAQIRNEKLFAGGTETFEEFTNATISLVGLYSQQAQRETDNNDLVVQQLNRLQESLSGVSIDEELTQMIQFQRAYEAAARYVSTVDELLETLVNI